VTGVSLNVNVGFEDHACFTRDLLSISRLVDLWSLLGVQIHVNLAAPSSSSPDPRAEPEVSVRDGTWDEAWDERTQAQWMEQVVSLLIAKPAVTGVFLEQFSDAIPHRFPHAGLLNPDGTPKQMAAPLRQRSQHDVA
jgi:hypothetical protein